MEKAATCHWALARAQLRVNQPHITMMQFPPCPARSASQEPEVPGGTQAPDILVWSPNPAPASLAQRHLATSSGNRESSF